MQRGMKMVFKTHILLRGSAWHEIHVVQQNCCPAPLPRRGRNGRRN